ncbi:MULTISPECIES: UDP-3-O-(3-hydroxymyristoyl)glucosamine N-acyltransferase [unclassified Hyphomicrobium]|uniref:UDP-3-O-(3-hydroxymyristoyl)glucosamine N-acyltransferase n=1 Tax=unclassified Hyphomicrobium TaxID=2619925 RepID=UPI000213EFC3|nr:MULTISPECIES: UDP-3-O-(3-hydroxymyristoyl)glucosamine N-acyltransferase [unclassified Hyphomicrobium]CCB66080.1 UDP-3-O-(3-hydroxymyristoyl)-glucosamine N-acyltransferase [Hyphomicrobium sp. MC1]
MEHPGFFERTGPYTLSEVAKAAGAKLADGANPDALIDDVRPLVEAAATHVSFIDNKKYLPQLATTNAGACLVSPALADRVPAGTTALVTPQPYHGFALALALFYPSAMQPMVAVAGAPPIDPTAKIEAGVIIEPGVIIGPGVQIGSGTRIAAGAVVGARVTIGRDCFIGPLATVTHALVGDRVIIHSGVRIGQDGFGFAMGRSGHLKVPQIGRVIIQDDVEIGANTTIDRGALKDTMIGEGTKIDNLCQIGHNVLIGRNCIIVAMCGISGSTELGDFVVMGGQSGTVGHIKIGSGAQVGGASHPTHDLAAGGRYFGTPAKPLRESAREQAMIKRLVARDKGSHDDGSSGSDAS